MTSHLQFQAFTLENVVKNYDRISVVPVMEYMCYAELNVRYQRTNSTYIIYTNSMCNRV